MPDEPADPSSGSALPPTPLCDGRFIAYRQLGVGSQAVTLEGVDRSNGTPVAIKRFDVHGAASWKDVELAEREASVLSTLSHPTLPRYVHHFEQDGSLYLVMEKVEGQDLSKRILSGQRYGFDEVLALLETLADVFAYLHLRSPPIVHRDIKPSNIVARADGGFALIDFGSVRDGLRPTGGSTVVGTFGFMAPEQFQGRALPATDLYGAGATILTLLTGTTPDKLPHRGLELDVRAALPSTTPPEWLDLLERLLSADPDRRSFDLRSVIPTLRHAAAQRASRAASSAAPGEQGGAPWHGQGTSADERSAHTSPRAQVPAGPRSESEWLFGAGTSLPFIFIVVLSLLRILLFLVMQIALPLLLTLLSVVFGKGLRRSAEEIANAGREVQLHLTQTIDRLTRSGPLVVRHRNRSWHWDAPRWDRAPFDPGSAPNAKERPTKRRTRVGNFYVDLPEDSERAEDAENNRRKRR